MRPMSNDRVILSVIVIAMVTAGLRFLPFLLFSGKSTPKWITSLAQTLPYAVMGMLVVYCLKDMRFSELGLWLPQTISVAVVGVLYVWKRNTLLSIVTGTVCYMLLIRMVFV